MSLEQFALLVLFVVVLTGTPGPANLSLMASGLAVGALRTIPFLLGTMAGFQAIFLLNAAGLAAAVYLVPGLAIALKIACLAYIGWLAWSIATADPAKPREQRLATPAADFVRGLWLHPVNPKAYAMQVAALAQFASPRPSLLEVAILAATFIFAGGFMNYLWAAGGGAMGRIAQSPSSYRALAVTLSLLMVASVVASLFLAPR